MCRHRFSSMRSHSFCCALCCMLPSTYASLGYGALSCKQRTATQMVPTVTSSEIA
jgi:hypothetical protein